jgi:hypothetical protein
VRYEDDLRWSLTASHECLELIVDPSLDRMVPGPSPEDAGLQVDFLVEICDPCQFHSYTLDGFQVAEFCTKRYYNDDQAHAGASYSFHGSISSPREILVGGYISWRQSGNVWKRQDRDGAGTFAIEIPAPDPTEGIRIAIDRLTAQQRSARSGEPLSATGADQNLLRRRRRNATEVARLKAAVLERHIKSIQAGSKSSRRSSPAKNVKPSQAKKRQ